MQDMLDLYEKVIPLAKLGIWERNLITEEVFWNSIMRAIYEVPEDSSPTFENVISCYDDPDRIKALIDKAILDQESQTGEFLIQTPKGNKKWIKARIHPFYKDGKCVTIYGTLEEITDQVSLIKLLEEREQRFHQVFDNGPIGMAIVSPEGKWLKVNKSLINLLGYQEHEFLQHSFQDFTYPGDLNYDLSLVKQLLNGDISSYNTEKRYYHKEGNLIWAHLSVSLIRDEQGVPLYFISQILNITERQKHAEILLRERQRLDNIIKSTHVGTWEWDIITDKMICNQRAVDILGFARTDLMIGLMKEWQRLIHPRDYKKFTGMLTKCFQKESKYFAIECRMRHKSGHWLWVDIRGKVISWSDQNKPLFMLGTYADIHERKTLQEESEQTLRIIKEQNSRLLNFAHIVSHNLRSHTGNIQMLLEVIEEEQDKEEQKKLYDMLVINSANLQNTLAHLNNVVKITNSGSQNKKNLDISNEIQKVLDILSESIRDVNANIEIDAGPDIIISYDPAYFESILLNLLSNCIKYRDTDRQLIICITVHFHQEKTILSVKDNGLGIDLAMHGHKLYGMYKTFHGNDDARGMGLFLVKAQVEAMGGKIEVRSAPGVGTTFFLEII